MITTFYQREIGMTTLRSPWLMFGWWVGLVTLLTGVATITYGHESRSTLVAGLTLLVAPGAWTVLRVPFMRVEVGARGVRNRGYFSTRAVEWNQVARVSVEEVDDKVLAVAFAPVIRLADGREWALMQLAGYSTVARLPQTRMSHQAALISAAAERAGPIESAR